MENQFTPSERLKALGLLLKIYRNEHLRPSREDARQIQAYIKLRLETGGQLRDSFGLNRILIALEAIDLAAEEIGLHGKLAPAFVMFSVTDSPEQIEEAAAYCNADEHRALQAFYRISLLESKTGLLSTDNFRNLFVSQAGDMRLILLLIAWCVTLMRQIKDAENAAARNQISQLAANLFAPLAHKLGLYRLKSELEDLSLKYLEHDAYYMIKDKLNATKQARDAYIERFIAPIRGMLDAAGLHYHIKGRTKSIYSIWQKMKKQQCAFEGVYDLFAIRIILDAPLDKEKDQCWEVFSLITARYESNLKRLRDWMTVPKSNGYESLHITVLGPENKWVEVQIRTERMDDIAEHGLAAHWRYKGVKGSGGSVDAWLADIRSALETNNESLLTEQLASKENAGKASVYVFTPKGDLLRLPQGATLLDFAYNIHSNVGNHCISGRIDGKAASIRQKLESGSTVEVITSSTQTPKAEWLNFVVSSHAKSKIRAAVKDLQARESVLGKELLERKFKNRKIDWDESIINQLIKKSGFKESNEFFKAISEGKLDTATVIDRYQAISRREAGTAARASTRSAEEYKNQKPSAATPQEDVLVIDRNLKGIEFQMARCCSPVYGDDVFGFVTSSGCIKIHRNTCPNAPALRDRFGYRIVKARWAGKGAGKYPITLHIVGHDDLGIVNNITSVISKEEHIMLRSINIDSSDALFSGILTVMVDDTHELDKLIRKLRTIKGVKAVSRA